MAADRCAPAVAKASVHRSGGPHRALDVGHGARSRAILGSFTGDTGLFYGRYWALLRAILGSFIGLRACRSCSSSAAFATSCSRNTPSSLSTAARAAACFSRACSSSACPAHVLVGLFSVDGTLFRAMQGTFQSMQGSFLGDTGLFRIPSARSAALPPSP